MTKNELKSHLDKSLGIFVVSILSHQMMEQLLSSATFIWERRVREHVQPLMYLLSSLCNLGGTLVLNCRLAAAWIAVDPTKKILPQAIIAIGRLAENRLTQTFHNLLKYRNILLIYNLIKKNPRIHCWFKWTNLCSYLANLATWS